MKVLLLLLGLSSCAWSQCQANPSPNLADPLDPKTVCVGPLAIIGSLPAWWRFTIRGADPQPQKGFVYMSVSTGRVMVSEDGQPYHHLAAPINKTCPAGQFVYGFFQNTPLCKVP